MQSKIIEEISRLNTEQKQAVKHINGPALVLAGAGSGKTRVVTLRIMYLLSQGIAPENILAVTFTNKAAQEMKTRMRKWTDADITVTTFHSFGVRVLRNEIQHLGMSQEFAIYDEEDSEKLIRQSVKEVFGTNEKLSLKEIVAFISSCKNRLLPPQSVTEKDLQPGLLEVYERYMKKLRESNAVDFDDLLFLPVLLFEQFPEVLERYQNYYRFVLVDEYQDTNYSQSRLMRLLTNKERNLFVVGDPDQSIYSWRGAIVEHILRFEKEYPGAIVLRLQQNYRSTETILQAANDVIKNNSERLDKSLWSDRGQGEKIVMHAAETERKEAEWIVQTIATMHEKNRITFSEIAIFYRTNFQSRPFEDVLLMRKIPYKIVGGISFYQRKEVKDILSFLKLTLNPSDVISFTRIINLPKRGLGDVVLTKLMHYAQAQQTTIIEYIRDGVVTDFLGFDVQLTSKQKEGLKQFIQLIDTLKKVQDEGTISDIVRTAIFESGYTQVLEQDAETREEKRANVEELLAKALEWEETKIADNEEVSLARFLEEIALASSTDAINPADGCVHLMTVHNAKGLEFDVVFLAGLEETLFPHINSQLRPDAIEEERRLFYVGMTRAKQYLFTSWARNRYLWGGTRAMRMSRFLREIPTQYIKASSTQYSPYIQKHIPPHTSSNITMEEFSIGEAVFHTQFGIGRIESVSEGSLGKTYDILFQNDGKIKKLVAKFAPLQSIKN